MKRKDIEKAAGDYSGSILGCEGSSVTVKRQSFTDGAEWRINSIWHTMDEEPQVYGEYEGKVMPQIPCLVLGHLSTGYGYGVRYWNASYKVWDDEECDDYECDKDNIEKWCYLDDLLPIKED